MKQRNAVLLALCAFAFVAVFVLLSPSGAAKDEHAPRPAVGTRRERPTRRAPYTGSDPDLKAIHAAQRMESFAQCGHVDLSNVEVLSWSPRAFLYRDFITEEMADHMIAVGYDQNIQPSKVADASGDVSSEARTSSGVFINPALDNTGVIECIEKRLAEWSQIPPTHGEFFYLLEYQPGQQYQPHWDFFDPALPGMKEYLKRSLGGQRIATALVYLYTPQKGGETVFPEAEGGPRLVPATRGDALLFFDMTPEHALDRASKHGGTPVQRGVKVCMTKWMTEDSGGHIQRRWEDQEPRA